jgi:hypothetical protein
MMNAAFIMPSTLSILVNVFNDDERERAIAIWASLVGADPHQRAGGDELRHRRRQRARKRADEEDHQPELHRALPSEAVAERASGEQQTCEHE